MKCLCCNSNYQKKFDGDLKKHFLIHTNYVTLHSIKFHKFILISQKGVNPYEYMNDWEKFNETSLLKKRRFFYNNLNIEDIIDADYNHTKGGEFGMKNLGEDNNLYIQRDKFLLSEVFRNFRNKFNKIYNLEPANFFLHQD